MEWLAAIIIIGVVLILMVAIDQRRNEDNEGE